MTTAIQANILHDVHADIAKIRNDLDFLMYNPNFKVEEKEFSKLREAYDLICKANDKLYEL